VVIRCTPKRPSFPILPTFQLLNLGTRIATAKRGSCTPAFLAALGFQLDCFFGRSSRGKGGLYEDADYRFGRVVLCASRGRAGCGRSDSVLDAFPRQFRRWQDWAGRTGFPVESSQLGSEWFWCLSLRRLPESGQDSCRPLAANRAAGSGSRAERNDGAFELRNPCCLRVVGPPLEGLDLVFSRKSACKARSSIGNSWLLTRDHLFHFLFADNRHTQFPRLVQF